MATAVVASLAAASAPRLLPLTNLRVGCRWALQQRKRCFELARQWSSASRFLFPERRVELREGKKERSLLVVAMDQVTSGKARSPSADDHTEPSSDAESELLHSLYAIPSIDKAWAIPSCQGGAGFDVVVAMSQVNLPANAKRTFLSTVYIPETSSATITDYHWSPFPFEISGASLIVPSPSGAKVLIIRNPKDSTSPTNLEIWGPGQLLREIFVASSVHGSVYGDGWFEGVSWSQNEESIAYVAEEPVVSRPVFGQSASTPGQNSNATLEAGNWKGQGDWVEDWGESYSGKRRPVLFVANVSTGAVQAVEGISRDISAGQVVWAPQPASPDGPQSLVFVGWSSYAENFSTPRKLGMKYCFNRPCHLYHVEAPVPDREPSDAPREATNLTEGVSSAFSPRFSPDGKKLVFLSAEAAVKSGAHNATNSLHLIDWPTDLIRIGEKPQVKDIVNVVQHAEEGAFPGLYCYNLVANPWLDDGSTLLLSSAWRSQQVILSIDVESGNVSRVSSSDSLASWNLLGLQNSCIVATVSSPIQPSSLHLGHSASVGSPLKGGKEWKWSAINVPSLKFASKIESVMQSMKYELLQVSPPKADPLKSLSVGSGQPFEAIFVSPTGSIRPLTEEPRIESIPPLVVVLHGGPHSVSQTSFSRNAAFLSMLGFNLLHVNYRGSLGFGEEALQSLLGNVGRQDVDDVLAALDLVIGNGMADPARVAVLGGSHGGFLATHLIGQAPDRFATGIARNPVCNVSSMVGITDIPDWCYVEAFGKDGLSNYSEAPSVKDLSVLYQISPIAHISNVKVPTLFLLGAQDRRVPVSNGFQYVQALRARGQEVKVIVFPEDVHAIDRPQSDFESFLNIGVWLKRFIQ
ncbi:acylamino-acid-releasing enzyme 1 isoform X1 [Physcomitrium patens]|uniref:Acylamino-acid-releasing enzyme n=3 Tax=Physcomitrium patens TaxID=3218 RepID=A0A7I3Z8L5_PHYPA|nr:acylamino-acid-releasing enzyme 1-like isoform X1 [Physcomitrium patens]|eukprot:XP_024366929.1 acylamino-acid-releasing enzyme 1-like isoform X1 [Physcomitrella patens]